MQSVSSAAAMDINVKKKNENKRPGK